MSFCQLIALSI